METMTDLMVDVETTHTDPEEGGLLQLAAVKFNYETGAIGAIFDRCPMLLPRRNWSDGTRAFWNKHPKVLDGLIARQEPGAPVFRDFVDWVNADQPDGGYRFWAKPLKFDWPFVESHLIQLDLLMPFPHWLGRDVNSFIGGLSGSPEQPDLKLEFDGDEHNALHDCAHQIEMLFAAKKRFFQGSYE